MILEFAWPTLNRPEWSARLRESLEGMKAREGDEHVITKWEQAQPRPLTSLVNALCRGTEADGLVILADHLVVDENLGTNIANMFEQAFEGSLFGVVGLNIENMEPLPGVREYCFMAFGKEFLRYFTEQDQPGPFCPEYYHFFADTECGEFAVERGCFAFARDARVTTYSMNAGYAQRDDTYRASRSRIDYDRRTREQRQKQGMLWGRNFDLVNEKKRHYQLP
jgi:hypothetical protein